MLSAFRMDPWMSFDAGLQTWEDMPFREDEPSVRIPAEKVAYAHHSPNQGHVYEMTVVDGDFLSEDQAIQRARQLYGYHYVLRIHLQVLERPSQEMNDQQAAKAAQEFTRALLPEVARLLPVVD
jgi:hypothetical protein